MSGIIAILVFFSNCEVLTTLTADAGRILSKLHAVQLRGTINFTTGIRVAQVRQTHTYSEPHTNTVVASDLSIQNTHSHSMNNLSSLLSAGSETQTG